MTLLEMWALIRDGGSTAILFLALVGGFRGWYVWGWYAVEQRTRIEKLEERLDLAVRAAERGSGLSDRALRQAEGRHAGVSGE